MSKCLVSKCLRKPFSFVKSLLQLESAHGQREDPVLRCFAATCFRASSALIKVI